MFLFFFFGRVPSYNGHGVVLKGLNKSKTFKSIANTIIKFVQNCKNIFYELQIFDVFLSITVKKCFENLKFIYYLYLDCSKIVMYSVSLTTIIYLLESHAMGQ